MRSILLFALISVAAAAQAIDRSDLDWLRTLSALAEDCKDPVLDLPAYRGFDPERDARRLADAMLRADPAQCPEVAPAAVAQLRERIGDPERADIDVELVELARRAAERGQGMRRDPALAERYGRMLWLFQDGPAADPALEAERQAWLVRPETVALLTARNAEVKWRSRRSLELHAGLLLRRDLPYYDPVLAVSLLERGPARHDLESRLRFSRLLTDGVHLPADFARAARPLLDGAVYDSDSAADYQRELLRIGRLAAAAARTPAERAEALRILSAAALDERFGSARDRDELLRGLGRVRKAALAQGDAERIGKALDYQFALDQPFRREGDAAVLPAIVLRALVGPDGRVVETQVVRSSGVARRDRALRATWIEHGSKVELAAVAGGRFAWVDLPPVDPLLTTYDAYVRHHPSTAR